MRRIAGFRVMAVTAGLVVAGTIATTGIAFAGAPGETVVEEGPAAAPAATVVVEEKKVIKFRPSINAGATIGYADQSDNGGDFGWGAQALARLHRYGGIQLEYWSLGNARNRSGNSGDGGHFDGIYVGVMPMIPISDTGLNIFGQVGGAFCDEGNDVAAGGGLLYDLPIEALNSNNVALLLRLDYKYFHLESGGETGQHLISFGFMVGFQKTK